MNPTEQANAERILEIFAAIQRRDQQRLLDLCHSDVECSLATDPPVRRDVTRLQGRASNPGATRGSPCSPPWPSEVWILGS